MADKNKINTVERPMSPHLQVYRISFTMMMSMMHRISGFILYLGSFLFLLWYLSIFFGEEAYNFLNYFFSFIIIKIALFLYTWVFFHHLFGGIRHFIWDFGFGFELNSIEWLARLTAIFSFTSASLLWLL
tara:strand:- start:363 stop:752 length:390 start_codon:yes stop_codon:yes gene_type:complete